MSNYIAVEIFKGNPDKEIIITHHLDNGYYLLGATDYGYYELWHFNKD